MRSYLTSPIMREMQIKTTVRYHLTSVSKDIKNERYNVLLTRMWRIGHFCALLMAMLTGTATMENNMEISLKTKKRTTIWSSIPSSGYLSKVNENINSKRYMHPIVHCSIIFTGQGLKTISASTDELIKKCDIQISHTHSLSLSHTHTLTHTLNGILFSPKNVIYRSHTHTHTHTLSLSE